MSSANFSNPKASPVASRGTKKAARTKNAALVSRRAHARTHTTARLPTATFHDITHSPSHASFVQTNIAAVTTDLVDDATNTQQGGTTAATTRCYLVRQKTPVWRVWDSTHSDGEVGRWWTLAPPRGSVSEFRKTFDVCREWSQLDRLTTCTLLPGMRVVVGSGHGVRCNPFTSYPDSNRSQVYIPESECTPEFKATKTPSQSLQFSWAPQ